MEFYHAKADMEWHLLVGSRNAKFLQLTNLIFEGLFCQKDTWIPRRSQPSFSAWIQVSPATASVLCEYYCMQVCVYVCVCVCARVCTCLCVYVCLYVCEQVTGAPSWGALSQKRPDFGRALSQKRPDMSPCRTRVTVLFSGDSLCVCVRVTEWLALLPGELLCKGDLVFCRALL